MRSQTKIAARASDEKSEVKGKILFFAFLSLLFRGEERFLSFRPQDAGASKTTKSN